MASTQPEEEREGKEGKKKSKLTLNPTEPRCTLYLKRKRTSKQIK